MATFTIATSGTEPITIQWQQDTAGDGIFADMVGENGTTLTVDDSSVNHYRANVSNACGAETSNVVQVTTTEPTYVCDAYETALLASSATDVWLANTDTNYSNGESITRDKGSVPLNSLNSNTFTTGILTDPCATEYAVPRNESTGGFLASSGFNTSMTFGMAALVAGGPDGGHRSTLLYKRQESANYIAISWPYGNGTDMRFQFSSTAGLFDLRYDDFCTDQEAFVVSFTFDDATNTYTLWKNWLEYDTGTVAFTPVGGSPQITFGQSYRGKMSHLAYWDAIVITAQEASALRTGWELNQNV